MCFGKFGTRAFRWAMGRPSSIKIVRLAAIWNFSWGGNGKLQKTAFFAKNPSPRYFLMGKFFQDRTMWKLSSRGFRKCGTFWAYDLFNGSYCCSKSAQGSKSVFVTKNKRCHKKRLGHNFEFSGLKRIAGLVHHMSYLGYSFQAQKIKIVAVSLFFDIVFVCRKKLKYY